MTPHLPTMKYLRLGLGLLALSAGGAGAAPAGRIRDLACPPGAAYLAIRSARGHRYAVPCGFYGRVGNNEDVYFGPWRPAGWTPGEP